MNLMGSLIRELKFKQSPDDRIFHVTTHDFVKPLQRHILKILVRFDAVKIPEPLIHGRWMKGANKFLGMDRSKFVIDVDSDYAEALRVSQLSQEMSKIACISTAHNETYAMALEMVSDLSRKVGVAIDSMMSTRASAEAALVGLVEENAGAVAFASTQNSTSDAASNDPELHDYSSQIDSSSQFKILDPNISQTKGRRKGKEIAIGSGRMKSGLETATKKKKRMCRSCHKLSRHESTNCPLNPNRQNRDIDSSSSDEPAALMEKDDDNNDD